MEMKNTYIKNIVITILVALIAGWIAYLLFDKDPMAAVLFAGLPTGWRVLSRFFGRWIITGHLMIVYILIKMILSCMLGWIILPVDLISNIVKLLKLRQK